MTVTIYNNIGFQLFHIKVLFIFMIIKAVSDTIMIFQFLFLSIIKANPTKVLYYVYCYDHLLCI